MFLFVFCAYVVQNPLCFSVSSWQKKIVVPLRVARASVVQYLFVLLSALVSSWQKKNRYASPCRPCLRGSISLCAPFCLSVFVAKKIVVTRRVARVSVVQYLFVPLCAFASLWQKKSLCVSVSPVPPWFNISLCSFLP